MNEKNKIGKKARVLCLWTIIISKSSGKISDDDDDGDVDYDDNRDDDDNNDDADAAVKMQMLMIIMMKMMKMMLMMMMIMMIVMLMTPSRPGGANIYIYHPVERAASKTKNEKNSTNNNKTYKK